ncbi:ARM repeat-containing protein [Neoconidiobolus thromboides FSU 785]|nr:ARM repeat-containing protein [Neoconidiobolus thromboides FSU 785]
MRGLINKLSENNIESILFEIEALYQTNSRNSVTSTITDIILDLISDKATLLDTFVILHSTIIASLYQLVGVELAAHFTQTLIEKFIKHYENGLKLIKDNDSNEIDTDEHSDVKISLNLITLISELYNLEVISCVLIYDLIKMFLKRLNSVNVELLLKIIRAIGSTLRNDDPTAMKDIILIAQKEMQKETKISSRMKFMMEVLTNIKNNKVKKNLLNQQNITNEEFIKKMKLFLKNIKKKKYVGHTEPLRVSLEDIKQTSVKGKWWLVGSAWKDNMYGEENQMTKKENEMDNDIIKENQASLLNLAREQGMNTDLRKQIFTTIMGSEDYIDAYEKLLKLNLSEKQMRDIPRVLLNCCGNEKIYNPYYTLLCIKFNMYKTSFKITFQYALWDLFRELGESNIGGFDTKIQNESKNVPVRKILNLGKLYGEMMGKNSVYLTVLKTLNFTTLKSRTRLLLQIILCNMLLVSNDEDLAVQISKIKELKELLNGIRFFLFNFIMKANSIQSLPFNDQEKEKILIMAKFLDQLLVI